MTEDNRTSQEIQDDKDRIMIAKWLESNDATQCEHSEYTDGYTGHKRKSIGG